LTLVALNLVSKPWVRGWLDDLDAVAGFGGVMNWPPVSQ